MTAFVRVAEVWKRRGATAVLKGVSLEADEGEVVCLLGPSGAGKSTLLRCINALDSPDRGVIYVGGVAIGCEQRNGRFYRLPERRLSRQRMSIGMVFQSFNLFPHLSVLRNVTDAPIRVRGERADGARERGLALLDQVGLLDKAAAFPRQLSGGQQQRVAIARALAMQPSLMLFDEPTSALDPSLAGEVLAVIRKLAAAGMTMLVVTHDLAFARDVAGSIAVMIDGAIAEAGPAAAVLDRPHDPRVRSFLARSR